GPDHAPSEVPGTGQVCSATGFHNEGGCRTIPDRASDEDGWHPTTSNNATHTPARQTAPARSRSPNMTNPSQRAGETDSRSDRARKDGEGGRVACRDATGTWDERPYRESVRRPRAPLHSRLS